MRLIAIPQVHSHPLNIVPIAFYAIHLVLDTVSFAILQDSRQYTSCPTLDLKHRLASLDNNLLPDIGQDAVAPVVFGMVLTMNYLT